MFELTQSFGLDLANPFARHRELLADFGKRLIRAHPDAEAHAYHALFARTQRGRRHGQKRENLPALTSKCVAIRCGHAHNLGSRPVMAALADGQGCGLAQLGGNIVRRCERLAAAGVFNSVRKTAMWKWQRLGFLRRSILFQVHRKDNFLAGTRSRQQRRSGTSGAEEKNAARRRFSRDEAPAILRETVRKGEPGTG